MTERPILFSAPMVLALLAGTKTQTRRIVKPAPPSIEAVEALRAGSFSIFTDHHAESGAHFRVGGPVWAVRELVGEPANTGWVCPYGAPGDRLWVKETWRPVFRTKNKYERIRYAADGAKTIREVSGSWKRPKAAKTGNVSPLFMPRWASRITLEVTAVRCEPLQRITESDAKAEGCIDHDPEPRSEGGTVWYWQGRSSRPSFRAHFHHIWESINGAGSWAANPWVWVVEFKRVEK